MEKALTPHSSTLAWKIPWTEEPSRLQSMGSLRVGHDWATSLSLSCIGEGNGNPLQCFLAWRIPGTAGPGGLPSLGSHRVGHDWSDLAAAAAGWGDAIDYKGASGTFWNSWLWQWLHDYTYVKTCLIVHLKFMNSIVCKLCFNKTVKKERMTEEKDRRNLNPWDHYSLCCCCCC